MSKPVDVFVSYSWPVERKTKIVDKLANLCSARNIHLIRDNNTLQHGDLIKDFMDKLTGAEHVLTVFSKPYFQSRWCMYELMCIWQKGDFKQRTHPIIADKCNLQDAAYRIGVVKYWVAEHAKSRQLLDGEDTTLLVEEVKKANMLRDISQSASEIMNFAAGRLTTPLTDLRKKAFAPVLDAICLPVQVGGGQQDWQAQDAEFMRSIEEGIVRNLKHSASLLEKLGGRYKVLESVTLAKTLIERCKQGEFVDIVQNTQAAFRDAWGALAGATQERNQLLDAADALICHLVLFNVKDDWLTARAKAGQPFALPKIKLESVNVVLSRLSGSLPSYKKYAGSKGTAGVVSGFGTALKLESGAKSTQATPLILKMLAACLMPERVDFPSDQDELAEEVNATLEYQRSHLEPSMRRRHFILLPQDSMTDPTVCSELQRLLPALDWVTVSVDGQQEVFVIRDVQLMTAIQQFFMTLEGANPA